MQLTAEPPLETICPEIVNMVLESVEVYDGGLLHFHFLDGTVLEIDTEEPKCERVMDGQPHDQADYGQCVYGYKNDRIVDLVAAIGIMKLKKRDDADDDLQEILQYWIL